MEEQLLNELEAGSQNASEDSNLMESTSSDESSQLDEEKKRLERQNKQLFARLKKLEEKLEKTVEQTKQTDDSGWREKVDFLIRHKDLDTDELEVVSAFAKGSGKSLDEAYKDPVVEGALLHLRQKKAVEKAALDSTSRSESDENSLMAKLKAGKLSDEEFRKNIKKIQEEFVAKKNRSFE